MCGFCGVWNTNDKKVNQEYLSLMSKKLTHRGPDDNGIWKIVFKC
jgi:asparagine synthetase B (glutamine-hydrolysing)